MSLSFDVSFHQIPLPGKLNKLGEDTVYVHNRCFAVFDGVGGWINDGVDVRKYALKLSRTVKEAFEAKGIGDPVEILHYAYMQSQKVTGTSTACVVVLDNEFMNAANVGDSQFIVVRDGTVIHESTEQQVEFNMPFQIGTGSDIEPRTHADRYTLQLRVNDVVVMGSDGLFDNLTPSAMVNSIRKAGPKGPSKCIARDIASKAFTNSRKSNVCTPFERLARHHGIHWKGGKPDDITVIVAKVVPAAGKRSGGGKASPRTPASAGGRACAVGGVGEACLGGTDICGADVTSADNCVACDGNSVEVSGASSPSKRGRNKNKSKAMKDSALLDPSRE